MMKRIANTAPGSLEDGKTCPGDRRAPQLQTWIEGGLAILDTRQRMVSANRSLVAWLAESNIQWQGKDLERLLAEGNPEWEDSVRACFHGQEDFARINLGSPTGQGGHGLSLELARNAAGFFVRLQSVPPPQDKRVEDGWDELLQPGGGKSDLYARLLRAEALLEGLVQHWPGAVFSQRADFSFRYASPRIETLTGVAVEEWRRQPRRFWQVIHESDIEELRQQMKRAQQIPQGVTTTYRIRHVHSGRVAYVLEHRRAAVDKNGLLSGYDGVWLDVTRQTIAEKRLSSAAWKETLAVLTMGLAHDFSNIMAGIHSLSESFLSQVGADHAFQEGLTLIKQNSFQASQLVHRIINLHHGKTGERNYHDLNAIVTDWVDLAQKILPRRVQVATRLASQELPLYVDAMEFRQVIINLTLNAAEAMPQGGHLQLETSLPPEFPVCGHVEGAWPRQPAVCLTVQDNGCGISPRRLAAIFDPFFTTKAVNKGSGLGLYNARLFVEKHQGALSVDSTEGVGTTFRIWLPQADFTEAEREVAAASALRRSLLLAGHAGKLLDDTAEFLRLNGYHVVVAGDRSKATDDLRTGDYQFGGAMILLEPEDRHFHALVEEVRRLKPTLKVIIQVVGGHPDELSAQVLRQSDLIVSPDMSGDMVMTKLKTILEGTPY